MTFKPVFTPEFKKQLKKINKDRALLDKIKKNIKKLCENPKIGKPLRHNLKGHRRIHINPFVLIYSVAGDNIIFHYYEHHDKAY